MNAQKKTTLLLLGMILAAFAIRLFISMYDITRLVQICLADDAFYYFKVAKNIAAGLGSTSDGLSRTNGYHPIYMLILTGIYKIFSSDLLSPIKAALIMLSLFNVMTGIFIYKILKRVCSDKAGLWGAGIFLFNPYCMFVALTGVETAIATFFISAAVYQFVLIKQKETAFVRGHIILGALLGLCLLSRTDSIIFCGFIFLDRLLAIIFSSERKKIVIALAAMSAAVFLLIAPWIAWNLINFGTIEQDSGKIIRYSNHEVMKVTYPYRYKEALKQARMIKLRDGLRMILNGNIPIITQERKHHVFVFIMALSFLLCLWRKKLFKKYLTPLYPVILTLIAVYFFYTLYFLHLQTWYFMSSYFICALIIGPALFFLQESACRLLKNPIPRTIFVSAAILLIVADFAAVLSAAWHSGFNRWQSLYVEGSKYIEEKLPAGTRIGSFNSGIYSYFTNKTVINLDGVVNHDMYEIYKNKTLMKYIREKKIDYIIDHNHELNADECFTSDPLFPNMEEIGRLKSNHPIAGDVLILRVKESK